MLRLLQIVLTSFLFFNSLFSPAQSDKDVKEKDVPLSVKNFVSKNYPSATHVNYYIKNENDTSFYEVAFSMDDDHYNLLLYPDGQLYETEIVMQYEELPVAVKEKITQDLNSRYSNYSIRLVEQVNPQNELKYEIKVRARKGKRKGFYEVFYDQNGNFLLEEEEVFNSIPSNSGF